MESADVSDGLSYLKDLNDPRTAKAIARCNKHDKRFSRKIGAKALR